MLLGREVARCQTLPPLAFPNNRLPTPQMIFRLLDARPLFFAIASNLVRCVLRVAASLLRTRCFRLTRSTEVRRKSASNHSKNPRTLSASPFSFFSAFRRRPERERLNRSTYCLRLTRTHIV